jgi:hypothetical protein
LRPKLATDFYFSLHHGQLPEHAHLKPAAHKAARITGIFDDEGTANALVGRINGQAATPIGMGHRSGSEKKGSDHKCFHRYSKIFIILRTVLKEEGFVKP